ncbi:hypothetical protein RMATCC62417_13615 [Rhizopus microsporus]|nr:hypothetical protein RMATCC62417_13615 [Rhizopus microsporus]
MEVNEFRLCGFSQHNHGSSKVMPLKQSPNAFSKSLKSFFNKLKSIHQGADTCASNQHDTHPNHHKPTLVPSQSLYLKRNNGRFLATDKRSFRYSLDLSTIFDSDSVIRQCQNNAVIDNGSTKKERRRSSRRSSIVSSIYSVFNSTETKTYGSQGMIDEPILEVNENRMENDMDGSCDSLTKDVQDKLWNEDTSFCPKEKISEWLGTNEPFRAQVLKLYMRNFDFTNKQLDEAFRILCSKLYFKAESQQLDRIIEAFAKRFYDCNPTTIFHSVDIIHAVSYSLLLLNTDLHVVSEQGSRMTRSSFVKNTMDTVQSLRFPHLHSQRQRVGSFSSSDSCSMRRRSVSISSPSFGSQSFKSIMDDPSAHSFSNNGTLFQKLDTLKSSISWKSSTSSYHRSTQDGLTRMQKTWLLDIEALLKDMYNAIKAQSISQADITESEQTANNQIYRSKTLPNNEERRAFRRRRGHSVISEKFTAFNEMPPQRRLTEPSPIVHHITFHNCKQGIAMRKHVMDTTDKKAKHRQWQLCYLMMTETEIVMYKPIQKNDIKGKRRKSMSLWTKAAGTPFSLQEVISNDTNEWHPDLSQPPMNVVQLHHCYATSTLPLGWNGNRPHVFRVETAEGGLWLFESTDAFAKQAWVESINLAAATISKPPMQGAVCNIDYGWGTQGMTSTHIPVWYPPTPCMIKSNRTLEEQYQDLETQIKTLMQELKQHRSLKPFNHACRKPSSSTNQLE